MKDGLVHHSCIRRRVLALGAGYLLARGATFSTPGAEPALHKVRKRSRALGSEVTLTVLHDSPALASEAIDAAFRELDLIENVMSLYRRDSQVSRLNRDGILANPHPHLRKVLNFAHKISADSDGAFDITVQPLWEAFQETKLQGAVPGTDAISIARAKIGWERVHVSDKRIKLDGEGAAITLNGIAQGYAADCVKEVLASAGIRHALIDCGEFSSLGSSPWKIGIQHPREEDAFIWVARLTGRCLATSGDYSTRFGGEGADAFRCHHLFDPKTGRSPEELASVSVVARTAMEADALSTAVFVAGIERGPKLIEAFPGADALLVLKNGRTLATKGFPCGA